MRKAALLTLTFLTSLPLFATTADRHQSFIVYDDGGTIVRQDDGRDVEARINLPIYPGDEVVTNRRGRSEIHLSDGNTVGVDRATTLVFRSILDSYEGEGTQTVAELRQGKVAVHRTDLGRDFIRLDTQNASYVAYDEAIYSVEADLRGRDRLTVFDGSVEVRTRARTTRVRAGEGADVDDTGVYDLVSGSINSADDFERWFLRRAERYQRATNHRHLDRRLSYWADDFDTHGRWVQAAGIGWTWRPYVSVGWRPYYHGYWHRSRWGVLTWVSYDPWGFVPYHYGRWAHDPFHGWVWVPGGGYSPAWVYWWYGPSYVGWAPAGWWDCHPRYYDWAYRPYQRTSVAIGFGFYGRVHVNDMDLRPWTFVEPNTLVSTRVDRAALTTDVIKQRFGRGGDNGFATVTSDPARFTREEFRNPADAVNRVARRGWGSGTGREPASTTDVTPFFRRDAELGSTVRERVARSRGGDINAVGSTAGSVAPTRGGSVAPIGGGALAPIGGGLVAPIGSGTDSTRGTREGSRGSEEQATRGTRGGSADTTPAPSRGDGGSWRDRVTRGGNAEAPRSAQPDRATTPTPERPSSSDRSRSDDNWRSRAGRSSGGDSAAPAPAPRAEPSSSSDAPRRVIDGIRGNRTAPRDDDSSTRSERGSSRGDSGRSRSTTRESAPRSERPSAPPPSADRGSSSRGDSGGASRPSGESRSGGESRGEGGGGGRKRGDEPR